jgi:hypothetical protein
MNPFHFLKKHQNCCTLTCIPPTLTRQIWKCHHDWMYARKRPSPVYSTFSFDCGTVLPLTLLKVSVLNRVIGDLLCPWPSPFSPLHWTHPLPHTDTHAFITPLIFLPISTIHLSHSSLPQQEDWSLLLYYCLFLSHSSGNPVCWGPPLIRHENHVLSKFIEQCRTL